MKNNLPIQAVLVVLMSAMLACSVTFGNNVSVNAIQGSGSVVSESRQVSNISSVELAMTGTLHITMGDKDSLTIQAEENLMGYIQTGVSLGRLVIKSSQGVDLRPTKPITYDLTISKLSEIIISSDGDIETQNLNAGSFSIQVSSSGNLTISGLECSSLQAKISSSGDITIGNLAADSIAVTISSSGNLEIEGGQAQKQSIHISSSGEYRANTLASTSADVTLSSSGSATIRVSNKINGSLTSSGNVYYIGNPQVNISTTSSGRAEQISQ